MIYMVDHIYANPETEPEWHSWYAGYLRELINLPGYHSAQRFKAIGVTPSRYLSIYTIASTDVVDSPAYKNNGGGGHRSVRFHASYDLWTRNLFEGIERAPAVGNDQRVLVFDAASPDRKLPTEHKPLWLKSVPKRMVGYAQQMPTPYRALIVLAASAIAGTADFGDGFLYQPLIPMLTPQ